MRSLTHAWDIHRVLVLGIKPHRFGAMSLPEHAAWLIEQVKSPRLKLVYDQSHYEHRGVGLEQTDPGGDIWLVAAGESPAPG